MKRFLSISLSIVFILACCVPFAYAAAGDGNSPMASPTISRTLAYAYTGDNTGELCIDFQVLATSSATSVGVSSIVIHKPDGSTYTVLGSVGNHFIGSGNGHAGTYVYKGESGKSYYAEVTFFATIGSTTSSKTYLTKSATAR